MRLVLFCLLFLGVASCLNNGSEPGDSDVFNPAQRLAELTEKKLGEVSGIAASISNTGYLWTHNDSGNPPVVYLLNEALEIRLACRLDGIKNRDWEDIAVGPGPEAGKTYVYVADIGDNNANYAEKYIYRFEEPVLTEGITEIKITDFDKITFTLEDGKKDTESLMVHPKTKDLFVISKREKPVFVYAFPNPERTDDTIVARKVTALPLTQIVSSDFSPTADEVLMKSYDQIFYWNIAGKSLEEGLQEKPHLVHYTEEPQGEAITFDKDGSGFYTLSEKLRGEKTYLYFYGRKKR